MGELQRLVTRATPPPQVLEHTAGGFHGSQGPVSISLYWLLTLLVHCLLNLLSSNFFVR